MNIRPVTEIGEITGKRVLVRVDWNVPMKEGGEVEDDFRIRASLPTLEFLRDKGAQVIIATHLEGGSMESLKQYVPDGMELLPNLRDNPGEKENDPRFAMELSQRADIFINEAFSVSHRNHASIVGLPKMMPSFAGLQFMREIESLSKAFNPPHPFLLILGGAKFETKLPLVDKFIAIADEIFIAGAMAKPASQMPISQNPKVSLPLGDVAALDADEANIDLLKGKVSAYKFIVWNGPLGKYEAGYKKGTQDLAKILSESGKEVIVGGADTLAVIKEMNLYDKFSFVSTGGGAMLDFLASGTLPGIEALNSRSFGI